MGRNNEKAMFAKQRKWEVNKDGLSSIITHQTNLANNIRSLESHRDRIQDSRYAMNPEAKKFAIKQYDREIKDIQKRKKGFFA